MKIQDNQDSDKSDSSSNKTVIEAEKKENVPDNVASCPPIPGEQVCNIDHPPGMESALKLNKSTGTENSTPPSSSSKLKYEY